MWTQASGPAQVGLAARWNRGDGRHRCGVLGRVRPSGCYRAAMNVWSAVTRRSRLPAFVALALLVLTAGCATTPTVVPSATPGQSPSATAPSATPESPSASASLSATSSQTAGERVCPYVPGNPVAVMPDEVLHPPTPTAEPTASLPPASSVDAATTKKQLGVLNALAKTVTDRYVDPHFNGRDWPAIVARYRTLVEGGLSEDDFYTAMELLVGELGDDHSQFQSPTVKALSEQELAGHNDYVGIGVVIKPVPEAGTAAIIETFPGGPADGAGLLPHDAILAIDGQPVFDAAGQSTLPRVRGPAGTQVTLTLRRAGEAVRELTLTRARVEGGEPIGSCLITGTRLGYLFLPTLFDKTIPGQVRNALRAMTADGPLEGLVIDNRLDPGGSSDVLVPILGFFLNGDVGSFQSRTATRRLVIKGENVGGSQTVPLIVLVGRDTVSFGEIMSGILQASGRARIVGETSLGNVETLSGYDFKDGSRAWLAHETFVPDHATYGPWEDTGIEPDVTVPTRWDLFTEANDPALAAALQELGVH